MSASGGWSYVDELSRFGVAVYNFDQTGFHRLQLCVGDTLHLLQENVNWYYGFKTKNRNRLGIFPKSFVHIKESEYDQSGIYPSASPKEPPIAAEITSTVREWLELWKKLFVKKGDHFSLIRYYMQRLIEWRKLLMCGKLTQEETRDHHSKVIKNIDTGNSVLGLDMVVRDEEGQTLDPEICGAVKLFRAHEKSAEVIRTQRGTIAGGINQKPAAIPKYTYSLMMTLDRPVHFSIGEELDLQFGLYDANSNRFFTDFYNVKLGSNGVAKEYHSQHQQQSSHNQQHLINPSSAFKVVYTDLGKDVLIRGTVYLVCQVVRRGRMNLKDPDKRGATLDVRRPFGVAVRPVAQILLDKQKEESDEKFETIPVFLCGERENFETLIKRAITQKDPGNRVLKDSLSISLRKLEGDYKQLMDDYPHLVLGNTAVARKMGFPDVIYPNDVRNDVYVTLLDGEFSQQIKNVEVTLSVHNNEGEKMSNVICDGRGGFVSEYKTVCYWHEPRPKWNETVKIQIPLDRFRDAHLRFVFKHRSATDVKDKAEKPYALAYLRLMKDKDGTTVQDGDHELILYTLNPRGKSEALEGYLEVPSLKSQLAPSLYNYRIKMSESLTVSNKDNLKISTLLCSTKLTQNVDILNVFNWRENLSGLEDVLRALMKVQGEEIVKFLQDVCDSLFSILIENKDCDRIDNLVFDCLVYIITLMSDRKYSHFTSVLDVYIQENFSATLAYNKLIVVLKYYVDHSISSSTTTTTTDDIDEKHNLSVLKQALDGIKYIFKFIIRSWNLFSELREGQGRESFVESLKSLFESMAHLMSYESESALAVQGCALKQLPTIVDDIIQVLDPSLLSDSFVFFLKNLQSKDLTQPKTRFLGDLMKTRLAEIRPSREKLLYAVCDHLVEPMSQSLELEAIADVLAEVMDLLHRQDDNDDHLMVVQRHLLRSVMRYGVIPSNPKLRPKFVSVLVAMLAPMSKWHYEQYLNCFVTPIDLLDFLTEIICVFNDLVSKFNSVFPNDWSQMLLFQHSVILKALRLCSTTITQYFVSTHVVEYELLNNFFMCAVGLLTHEQLQLETFSQNKRKRIILRYKDMRVDVAKEVRQMWQNLGPQKKYFVPSSVRLFLEMNLIPKPEIRRLTIPIFFDMMECEFFTLIPDHTYPKGIIKGSFYEFESEMIEQLDVLVEGGLGDEAYNRLFKTIMTEYCEGAEDPQLRAQGNEFVKTVNNLFQRLLHYRSMINDESVDNRMKSTVNLLEFYNELERQEMYIRYLYKLSDLHLDCDNFVEAAYTLMHHARLLTWSVEELTQKLETDKYPDCHTHLELKARLYNDIIDLFDKGKLWEKGIELCRELALVYENDLYDYGQLSFIHRKQATFFDRIMKDLRHDSEYFRVGFYGRGYPSFLQNKEYIYRGQQFERLSDFQARIQNQYPQAKIMEKLLPPNRIPAVYLEAKEQYLQINRVTPVMDPGIKRKFKGKNVALQISSYYKVNEVKEFFFDQRLTRPMPGVDEGSEIGSVWVERTKLETSYSLPGILRWFPVAFHKMDEICPLQFAVETMEEKNNELRSTIDQAYLNQNFNISMLGMKLNGVVDAAVQGGTKEYEKAFFTDGYLKANPTHKLLVEQLKDQIAMQIPILDDGINIHEQRVADDLRPFHQRIKDCFNEYRAHVLRNYGKAEAYEVAYRRRPPPRVHQQQQQPQQHAAVSYIKQDGAERRTSDANPDGAPGDTDSDESLHGGGKMSTSIKNSMGSRIASNSLLGSVAVKTFSPNKWINSAGKHLSNSSSGSSGSNGATSNAAQQHSSHNPQHNHQPSAILNGGSSLLQQQQQIELSQELTPKRPPRPSMDARNATTTSSSRPQSDGSLNNSQSKEALHGGGASSTMMMMHNSHSVASTTFSESIGSPTSDSADDNAVPPPLPSKGDHTSICSISSGTGISLGVDSVGGHGDFSLLPQIQASLSSMALGGGGGGAAAAAAGADLLSPDSSAAPPAVPRKGEAPPPSLPKKGRTSIQGLNQI